MKTTEAAATTRKADSMKHSRTYSRNLTHSRRSNGDSGFTLVEVVIAIATLAVILGVAYSALNQIIVTKRVLDDKRDVAIVANAVLERMVRELQMLTSNATLLPPPGERLDGSANSSLLGESKGGGEDGGQDRITFLAQEAGQYLPDGGTHSGIVQITYRVETDKEVEQVKDQPVFSLIRDEIPNSLNNEVSNSEAWDKARKEAYDNAMVFPVTNRLVSLKIRYYDQQEQQWVDEWGKTGSRSESPRVILVSIGLRSPLGTVYYYTTAAPVGVARARRGDI